MIVTLLCILSFGVMYMTSWGLPASGSSKPWKLSTGKPCARTILGKELVTDEHGT